MIKNDNFLKALRREPVDMTPVWIMRQAGRYLPEYRETRAKAGSFMRLCKTPELACEVTLQPIARYPLDASIIFSDILTIPDAMGLGLEVLEGKGPVFQRAIRNESDIKSLSVIDPEQLTYVYDAIRLVKQGLADKIPLIGFTGSPFTLAAYMVEGESKTGFPHFKTWISEDPATLHPLLSLLADSVTAHLAGQIEAGADAVMIFDTWGGMLGPEHYELFSLDYVKRSVNALKKRYKDIPIILFTKGGHHFLDKMVNVGCEALGVDWEVTLQAARQQVGDRVALQGNLNPSVLLESPEVVRREVLRVLDSFGHGSGHVFNLGHGITPQVPPENVAVLVEAVHELSKPYHRSETSTNCVTGSE